jgi:glycosyltransferase involved in cell wall biosynthesis
MNILYIVSDLGMGGTQGWVEYAALELIKLGHKVVVIAENAPHDRKTKIEGKGVIVHAFETPPDLSKYRQIALENGVEVIHLNVWERFPPLIQLRELCNVPVALSYHSVPRITWKQWIVRIIKPSKMHWGMYDWFTLSEARRYVDAHIGCCDTSARGIRNKLWPFMQDRVFSLPNAIPLPELISQKILLGPPHFLQVGALTERKNPFLTIKAFEKVQESLPLSSLTIVGDGPLYNELRNYIQERKIKNVSLVGEVLDPTTLYLESNMLILPSRCEGFPYTLIEGAGHGLPLIGSDVDGIPEICVNGFNGIILPQITENSLQEAMHHLATDITMREQFSINSRKLVEEKFEINLFINKLVTIYSTIMERKYAA